MTTFGEELRRQRELRGVSLREISDATKINIRFLESLEQNDFTHLPGGQFNKGFIRAYSRHIGVDPEQMVESYLLEIRRQEERARAAGRASMPHRSSSSRGRWLLAAAIAVIVLALGGGGTWWMLSSGEAPGIVQREAATDRPPGGIGSPSSALTPEPPAGRPPRPATAAEAGTAAPAPAPTPALRPERAPLETGLEESTAESAGSRETEEAGPDDVSAPPPPAVVPAVERKLTMRLTAVRPVQAAVSCDGASLYAGRMEAGRSHRFECSGLYEVSLADAGAVNVSIDGERIYLGRPGQSVAGRHVSKENFMDYARPPLEAEPE